MVEVTSHSINPPTEDTLADIKILINSRIPLLVGGKVPVDISTSVGSMNVNAFPTANLGQQPVANSLSVTPASDIADPTYIGDIRFGEALPVGDNVIGKVKIDQAIPGTTNLVNVNGGASQTADIKVTLDSETIAVTGPLTDAQLSAQSLAKEATLGSIKTATEAMAVATPDTAAGDMAAINTASASIDGKLPALVGGKIPVDASFSLSSVAIDQTTPGTTNLVNVNGGASQTADIKVTLDSESVAVTGPLTDAQLTTQALAKEATLGSIKTATEAMAVATPDTAAGDMAAINTASASIDGKLPALVGGKIPVDASFSLSSVAIDQTTPGTTNLVNVNGGASQTADIKVTLDSESVAVTGPLTDAQLTTQALAKEATLGGMATDLGTVRTDLATVKADIALMKADLAAILAILES